MKNPRTTCSWLGGAALLAAAMVSAVAQQPERTFGLSAINIGGTELPPLYYQTIDKASGERSFVSFRAGEGSRSRLYQVPLIRPVKLYTGESGADGEDEMESYLDVPANSQDDQLLLVFYLDSGGNLRHTFLDDSAETHPAGTVRFANFSNDRVAFQAGGDPVGVRPAEAAVADPVFDENNRIPFSFIAERDSGQPYTAPTKLLRFRSPDARLLVVYASLPREVQVDEAETGEFDEDGNPITRAITEVQHVTTAYRLYDTVGK